MSKNKGYYKVEGVRVDVHYPLPPSEVTSRPRGKWAKIANAMRSGDSIILERPDVAALVGAITRTGHRAVSRLIYRGEPGHFSDCNKYRVWKGVERHE